MPAFPRIFVDSQGQFCHLVPQLLQHDAIGLDVEMGQRIKRLPGGVTKGEQILGLIQIAGGDVSLVIDPLCVSDLSPLTELMAAPTVKVVLGGANDIQLLELHGLVVHNVADLAEMAVSVFGHKEESMRALANRALGIQIDKSIRREDWLRRPIHPAMLSYAHRDAELTLLLYRWFQEHHASVVAAHVRKHYAPVLPGEISEWIRRYMTKRQDAVRLLKEFGMKPESDAPRILSDVTFAWQQQLVPAQRRRLMRLIGELRLSEFGNEILPYTHSASSVFRSSAARTLGRLRFSEARSVLEGLTHDEISDVRSAAELGLRDMDADPDKSPKEVKEADDEQGLAPQQLAALEALRERLGGTALDHEPDETSDGP